MKTLLKQLIRWCKQTIQFIEYLLMLCIKKKAHLPKPSFQGSLAILATGPSLKSDLPLFEMEEYKNIDKMVMNFFAFDDVFFKLKPKHYCLADPMYFHHSWRDEEVFRLFNIFQNKVDWDMNIYVPVSILKEFTTFSQLKNPHLKIWGANTLAYRGYEKFRMFFYRKGHAMPTPQTVTNFAIFIGLNLGYTEIRLFGVDHTFLSSLRVNDKNQLCQEYSHYYDEGNIEYKILYRTEDNEVWKIGDYIMSVGQMFKSHDLLAEFAKYKGIQILNYTKGSMIDSYERAK